jgi:stage II sporulation protein D
VGADRTIVRYLPLALGVVAAVSGCLTIPVSPSLPRAEFAIPQHIRVQFNDRGTLTVKDVPLEDYVRASALSEFAPPSGDLASVEQMLEVQAVIGRTYAVSHLRRHGSQGFDLCSTTHCQLYEPGRLTTSRWAAASAEAVDRTAGMVLSFQREPADALFHADCGGHTSEPSSVWGGRSRPYLLSRADTGDGVGNETHAHWEYQTTVAALVRALDADARTRITGQFVGLDIASRDDAGRAERVAIRSQPLGKRRSRTPDLVTIVRGEDFRSVLARAFGARSIRSTWFRVTQDRATVTFSGRGFGHGVGLCQAGALARLKAGATPSEVLRVYYPATVLTRTYLTHSANER